jgi:hypothetical protein
MPDAFTVSVLNFRRIWRPGPSSLLSKVSLRRCKAASVGFINDAVVRNRAVVIGGNRQKIHLASSRHGLQHCCFRPGITTLRDMNGSAFTRFLMHRVAALSRRAEPLRWLRDAAALRRAASSGWAAPTADDGVRSEALRRLSRARGYAQGPKLRLSPSIRILPGSATAAVVGRRRAGRCSSLKIDC